MPAPDAMLKRLAGLGMDVNQPTTLAGHRRVDHRIHRHRINLCFFHGSSKKFSRTRDSPAMPRMALNRYSGVQPGAKPAYRHAGGSEP